MRPFRHDDGELLLEAAQALERILDRVDRFLKDDLLRGMLELLTGEPAPMRQRPMAAAAVNPAVPQQERKKLLALAPKIVRRRLAGAHKIPDRLMRRVRHPHAGQLAGPMQPRQRDRIPPVRLDPLARLVSGSAPERPPCSHGRAPGPGDKARIPSARFKADMQLAMAGGQLAPGSLSGPDEEFGIDLRHLGHAAPLPPSGQSYDGLAPNGICHPTMECSSWRLGPL